MKFTLSMVKAASLSLVVATGLFVAGCSDKPEPATIPEDAQPLPVPTSDHEESSGAVDLPAE